MKCLPWHLALAYDLASRKGWALKGSLTPARSSAVDTLSVETQEGLAVLKVARHFGLHLRGIERAYQLREQAGAALDEVCTPILDRGRINSFAATGIPYGLFKWIPGSSPEWGSKVSTAKEGAFERWLLQTMGRRTKTDEALMDSVQTGFRFATGALTSLAPIHSTGLAHRDVKPNNLIFEETSGRPIWIDLDSLAELEQTSSMSIASPYSAPETIFEDEPVRSAQDIFAAAYASLEYLGEDAVSLVDIRVRSRKDLFDRLAGLSNLPFKAEPLRSLKTRFPEEVQDQAARLIEFVLHGLQRNSSERPTAKEGLEILTGRRNLREI